MKRMTLLLLFPLSLSAFLLWAEPQPTFIALSSIPTVPLSETPEAPETVPAASTEKFSALPENESDESSKKELVTYAMSLLGTPYVYAGVSPGGFDCSGFVTHVFKKFDVAVPHSSALQAKEGEPVARDEAKVGDVVIFTGTKPSVRTPGHVGIIISTADNVIEFVHSSSVGGVKVSKVEGTGYSRRFLEIRRLF